MRRRPILFGAAAVVLVLLFFFLLRPSKVSGVPTLYHEVKRGDFTVSVVEGGTLAAVSEVSIRNEVEGIARIISIVPEGTYVKKGDLLVELDSAQAQDQVNQQLINYEKAKFAVEQALAQLEIQRSATNSDFLAAKLKLQFAEIDRDKYLKGQRLVDLVEASNRLVQAQNQLAVNSETYSNSWALAQKGYETKQRVQSDFLAVMGSQNSVIVASNTIAMLLQFDVPKMTNKYESDVLQAQQELERVVNQNKRRMAQYEADLITQSNTLVLSEKKLERDMRNLKNTKIYAPQDGLVVYAVSESHFSSESLIEGGATVRNRQELIKLPDLSRMKVNVKVHESHINMIRPGLPAFVILDSMPDQRFAAVVEKVAPLPDTQARWGNPNLKVYNTEIHITEPIPSVKPGVSAKAEILITNIADALSVPIYAVTTYKGKQVVYAANNGKHVPQPVEVGMYNTKFIEITKGLKEGDRVLLSPPFDTQEKDLEGTVLAADEKARLAVTNAARRAAAPSASPTPPAEEAPPTADRAAGLLASDAIPQSDLGDQQSTSRRMGPIPEEMMKEFDKNGDGELDDTEREALRTAMVARFRTPGGGQRMGREEMLKRFDKNGDGELDESERATMRETLGAARTNRPGRRFGYELGPVQKLTNSSPARVGGSGGEGGRTP
jgi:HlyD family secretion protein